MLVVALIGYKDTITKKSVIKGDIFETDRYKEININAHKEGLGAALGKVIIEDFSEEVQEQEQEVQEQDPKIDYNSLTVNELKEKLDELNIEYNARAKKAELVELVEKGVI